MSTRENRDMTREDRVFEFINASSFPSFRLAWTCLSEECLELKEAAEAYHLAQSEGCITTDEARASLVKEWADVQYVLSQLAIFYGINGEEAFNRVADNNMTKVVCGKVIYREDGKILKPENYQKPDMRGL